MYQNQKVKARQSAGRSKNHTHILGVVSEVPMGEWGATVQYQKLNKVRYVLNGESGVTLLAKKANKGVEPFVPQTWQEVWMVENYDGGAVIPNGSYPDMTVGNSVRAENDGMGNNISERFVRISSDIQSVVNSVDQAKEIAREALDQAKVTGTKVNLNGEFQTSLNFSSDPQSQINDCWKFKDAIDIPANADLNEYKTAGNYAVQDADNFPSIKNKPIGLNSVFQMKVYSLIGHENSYPVQEIMSFESQRYIRRYNSDFGGSWGNWTQTIDYRRVREGASLQNEPSGFYDGAYEKYSKSIKIGGAGDSAVMTWQFGGDSAGKPYGLWLRIYNSGNLQYEQRLFDGESAPLSIDASKLEPSVTNGWTIGGTTLELSCSGIYMMSVKTASNQEFSQNVLVIVDVDTDGNYSSQFFTSYTGGTGFLKVDVNKFVNYIRWSALRISNNETISIELYQVAYKKIA